MEALIKKKKKKQSLWKQLSSFKVNYKKCKDKIWNAHETMISKKESKREKEDYMHFIENEAYRHIPFV